MPEDSLVSVIIPTYMRGPDLISRSINSVLNQTYNNLELIIVDDSPASYTERNNVADFVDSINDNRIKYIQHDENKGANVARNTGIKNSNGKYCAFLDDDDEWLPEKLEKQLPKFSEENVALVYCGAIEINETTGQTRNKISEMHEGYQYKMLLRQNFVGSNSYVVILKDIFEEVGLYDESLPSHQDYDLYLRIAKKYKIKYVNEPLVKYYVHDGERISTNPLKVLSGRMTLYKKYEKDIESDPELSLIWRIKSVPMLYESGQKKYAFKQFLGAMTINPKFTLEYLRGTLSYIIKKKSS